jgi:hypothetical protein
MSVIKAHRLPTPTNNRTPSIMSVAMMENVPCSKFPGITILATSAKRPKPRITPKIQPRIPTATLFFCKGSTIHPCGRSVSVFALSSISVASIAAPFLQWNIRINRIILPLMWVG